MSQWLTQGAVVCIIGLGTVFSVLAIIWVVLEIMHLIFAPKHKKPASVKTAKVESTEKHIQAPVQAPCDKPKPAQVETTDFQLIAVLTAAVAAYLQKPSDGLYIRSYRRIDGGTPVWNKVARRDNIIG